jgi:soluble lytic murein transglycosylase
LKFRAALLAICAAVAAAGVAADLTLLDRAPPPAERKLKEQPRFGKGHLRALLARRAPRLPDELRERLADAILVESARSGYDPIFVLSLVAVESGFRVGAESERGARGLVQLKPSTFAWISAREPDAGGQELLLGEDPVVDLRLAVRYIRWLEKKFKTRDAALMAYNAGPRRAREYLRDGEVPERLRAYVKQIRREHERLAADAALAVPLPELPAAAAPAPRPVLLAQALRFNIRSARE